VLRAEGGEVSRDYINRHNYERKAIADAAYDAWRSGRDYDDAWDAAERAIDYAQPADRIEAEEVAERAVRKEEK
jgi:hypothetical protein